MTSRAPRAWMRWWADTLFKRLFLLMWVGLVASHLLAFTITTRSMTGPDGSAMRGGPHLPVFPSLPPTGGPAEGMHRPPPDDFGPDDPGGGLSTAALWLDYGVRFAVIGVFAWLGARWLSAPMRRLADASEALGSSLGQNRPQAALDEERGTLEVRQTAQVFNVMAARLHAQFDAQALLMAAISHDLRTPLARLRLRLETMQAAPEHALQIERCVADVREMDGLIGEVLAMLRDKHLPAEREQIDLQSLTQSIVDDLAEQGQPALMVDDALSSTAVIVSARPGALSRVLGNLIGNAMRHGGSARVGVSVDEAADEAQVVIDDDGPGIAADRLEAVFEPFYRLDASRSRDADRSGGSGLGLYIARDLAERDGGRILLANRAGGGLRASLVLPLA
jgi:signal transduction histidine kinase